MKEKQGKVMETKKKRRILKSVIGRGAMAATMLASQIPLTACSPNKQKEDLLPSDRNPAEINPVPKENTNSSTPEWANSTTMEVSDESIPAIVPTEENVNVVITSANYPKDSSGFILDDERSNQEKLDLIKSWAPNDYQKVIDLYNAEFERMGIHPSTIDYKASIVNGKSWIIVPKSKITGRMYIPSINGVIQASLSIFEHLDKSPNEDFFDLIEVNIDNPKIIGDITGWHLVVGPNENEYYDATDDTVKTIEKPSTPTPESRIEIVDEDGIRRLWKEDPFLTSLPEVDLDYFLSGKLLKDMRQWAEENPFSENAVPVDIEKYMNKTTIKVYPERKSVLGQKTWQILYNTDPSASYKYNESRRPVKVVGFFKLWDENLYNESGYFEDVYDRLPEYKKEISENIRKKNTRFVIMPVAYLNPDRSTSFIFYISPHFIFQASFQRIFDRVAYTRDGEQIKFKGDTKICPVYKIENTKLLENMETSFAMINYIWENYPQTNPSPYIDQWVETDTMPDELENCLFTFNDLENDPW